MKTTRIMAIAVLLSSLAASGASAGDQDPFAMYVKRSYSITLGAGDAKAVNAATHVIDPWPRYVGNRNIPVSGERLSRAVVRYNQGSYRQPAPPIFSPYGALIGITGSAGAGGGGGGGGGGGTGGGGGGATGGGGGY
jgi:hypothetical protein